MTKTEIEREALELSDQERLELAEALLTSVAERLPLPDWQRELLDERLAAVETDPGRDWEEIRAEIWPRTR